MIFQALPNVEFSIVQITFASLILNIKRSVKWSTSIVAEEKRQLLMSPRLTLGGAIGM